MDKVYKITIEGQTLDNLPEAIAGEDNKLKQVLSPFFPGAANAKFMRSEKDGVVTVNVIKQAGTKGVANLAGPDLLRENYPTDNSPAASETMPDLIPENSFLVNSQAVEPLDFLLACPESKNPVMVLSDELAEKKMDPRQMDAESIILLDRQINEAIEEGEKQLAIMQDALKRLYSSRAVPSIVVPTGL